MGGGTSRVSQARGKARTSRDLPLDFFPFLSPPHPITMVTPAETGPRGSLGRREVGQGCWDVRTLGTAQPHLSLSLGATGVEIHGWPWLLYLIKLYRRALLLIHVN